MKKYKRIFLFVLDSFGIGAMPDALQYGDAGANTFATVAKDPAYHCPTLESFGLLNIDHICLGHPVCTPFGAFARMTEASHGKDTIIGHWEMCGVISEHDLPTYPNGFPEELLARFKLAVGRDILCNRPYSGTKVIEDYGDTHIKTGKLIVYTSADSVFQIAAHEDIVPLAELYHICEIARGMLTGKNAVGRVIARPFSGTPGNFTRTAHRHDYALEPPHDTVLDYLKKNGCDVIAIGKIHDIFAGRGITQTIRTTGNEDGMKKADGMLSQDFHGLCFVNLVDFDMLYGHRNDIGGYAAALSRFDCFLKSFHTKLHPDDLLMITADHGCDPGYPTTDHTREYTPLLVCTTNPFGINLGTRKTFSDIGKTILENFECVCELPGESFLHQLTSKNTV